MDFGEPIPDAQRQVQSALRETAGEFLRLGLERFLSTQNVSPLAATMPQVTVGVLGIGCELLLKALVANAAFPAVFASLPQDLAVALTAPARFTKRRDLAARLLEGDQKVKTAEFAEVLAAARLLFPELSAELHSYLANVPPVRNRAVHAALSPTEHHNVEWIAFAAIGLHGLSMKLRVWLPPLPPGAEAFATAFNAARAERVQELLAEARKNVKALKVNDVEVSFAASDPDVERVVACVVCGVDGFLGGALGRMDDGTPYFFASSFECVEGCKLHIVGRAELRLAGFELAHDAYDGPPEDEDAWRDR